MIVDSTEGAKTSEEDRSQRLDLLVSTTAALIDRSDRRTSRKQNEAFLLALSLAGVLPAVPHVAEHASELRSGDVPLLVPGRRIVGRRVFLGDAVDVVEAVKGAEKRVGVSKGVLVEWPGTGGERSEEADWRMGSSTVSDMPQEDRKAAIRTVIRQSSSQVPV